MGIEIMVIPASCIGAYLIGGIPTAFLLAKRRGVSILSFGSGSSGATNTARSLGVKNGLIVAVIDILKGALPVLIARSVIGLTVPGYLLTGLSAVFGHIYSPYLKKFKGGKGVATGAGTIAVIYPPAIPFALTVFALVLAVSRYSSAASLTSLFLVIPYYILLSMVTKKAFDPYIVAFLSVLLLLIAFSHRKNLYRLIHGTELTFTSSKQKSREEIDAHNRN
ncbi:MAG: glycerol-3-phosphate 1-O-acyltransferase PlsY [Spirochaetaceae bacterium JB067]